MKRDGFNLGLETNKDKNEREKVALEIRKGADDNDLEERRVKKGFPKKIREEINLIERLEDSIDPSLPSYSSKMSKLLKSQTFSGNSRRSASVNPAELLSGLLQYDNGNEGILINRDQNFNISKPKVMASLSNKSGALDSISFETKDKSNKNIIADNDSDNVFDSSKSLDKIPFSKDINSESDEHLLSFSSSLPEKLISSGSPPKGLNIIFNKLTKATSFQNANSEDLFDELDFDFLEDQAIKSFKNNQPIGLKNEIDESVSENFGKDRYSEAANITEKSPGNTLKDLENIMADILISDDVDQAFEPDNRTEKCLEGIDPILDYPDLEDILKNTSLSNESSGLDKLQNARYEPFLVISVVYSNPAENTSQAVFCEKSVIAISQITDNEVVLNLKDVWTEFDIAENDIIHVFPPLTNNSSSYSNTTNSYTLDFQCDFLLVVNPHVLVPITTITGASSCIRRAVLKNKFRYQVIDKLKEKSTGIPDNLKLSSFIGNMTHSIFESAAIKDSWDPNSLELFIEKVVYDNIDEVWNLQLEIQTIIDILKGKTYEIIDWAKEHVASCIVKSSVLNENESQRSRFPNNHHNQKSSMGNEPIILEFIDNEENIRSSSLGLSGKIDLTVLASIDNLDSASQKISLVPLEVKSGSPTGTEVYYRAQVLLYILLLSEKYKIEVDYGILLFISDGTTRVIKRDMKAIQSLIILRNRLVVYFNTLKHDEFTLPELLLNPHKCENCTMASVCLLWHYSIENGSFETSGVSKTFWDSQVGNLSQSDLNFFYLWNKMCDFEEAETITASSRMWLESISEKVESGRSVNNLIAKHSNYNSIDSGIGSKLIYTYRFRKASENEAPADLVHDFQIGDPIVVCKAEEHYSVATGFITELSPTYIKALLDHKLEEFELDVSRLEKNIKSVLPFSNLANHTGLVLNDLEDLPFQIRNGTRNTGKNNKSRRDRSKRCYFRVDKGEISIGPNLLRTNIAGLFLNGGDEATKKLVVDLSTPTFSTNSHFKVQRTGNYSSSSSPKTSTPNSQMENDGVFSPSPKKNQYSGLNSAQLAAIDKVQRANDYTLILGMPGTGKTTTISHLVRHLALNNKSVLLVSYTHTAVDNVLLKLDSSQTPFLRIARKDKVHPDIKKNLISEKRPLSIKEADDLFMNTPIIATTCLSINHVLFNHRSFDYCIVDEASQIVLPACIGPLRFAKKFVLVGDHFQLPPLLKSRHFFDQSEDMAAESLFKILIDKHPSAVSELDVQFRMSNNMQYLPNVLVYNNRLKCGSAKVAYSKLNLPYYPLTSDIFLQKEASETQYLISGLNNRHSASAYIRLVEWLNSILDPSKPVLFLSTSSSKIKADFFETSSGSDSLFNNGESKMISIITYALLCSGIDVKNGIGVISPYRAQIECLKKFIYSTLLKFANNMNESALKAFGSASFSSHKRHELVDANGSQQLGSYPSNFTTSNNSQLNFRTQSENNFTGTEYSSDSRKVANLNIEIDTVDRYQGRDKEAILISWVRSNQDDLSGYILKDWRRINVALTRSKTKLIMIGSTDTLSTIPFFSEMIESLKSKNWVHEISHDVLSLVNNLF
ncbi:hypothetical protein BB560_001002 [Smittium megazygosporum]|uniref:DNA replication ATP-dependent helicase/nuclease DNA2 n=1 Tax=Smittium megazygosporum TaxID=133381 RepID=A0A2T9ZJ10_9FUNG|nr:hypothetical protein BB560_001002 [Smittium megazygosporum]